MCQIIQGASRQLKLVLLTTPGLLEELHKNNPDGWGCMYHTTKGTKAIKKLPASVEDTRAYVTKLPDDDRQVALHWRWRTSGKVDQHNAHPHQVNGGWLIHNGILDVDTDSKPEMCDTYHFARQYLDGSVDAVIKARGLQDLIGEFIGNNRFVLMSDSGEMCIINEKQGYRAQGLWFANGYSMSRGLVDPTYRKPVPKAYQYNGFKSYPKTSWNMAGVTDMWDENGEYKWEDEEDEGYSPGEAGFRLSTDVDEALDDSDSDTLQAFLEEFPLETLSHILGTYDITEYSGASPDDLTKPVILLRDLLLEGNVNALVTKLETDITGVVADRVAQCLLWFCVTMPKEMAVAA